MYNDSLGNHLEQNDKSIFGIFLNQARLNAYITLCYISENLSENPAGEDQLSQMNVLKCLTNNDDPVKSQRVTKLIEDHFPMIQSIYRWQNKEEKANLENRSKEYFRIIECLLNALNDKRNEYCHVYPGSGKRKYDEQFLIQSLENCFDVSVNEVKKRFSLKDDEVFHLRRKTSKNKQTVANDKFFQHFRDQEQHLSQKGLAFLAAIFLDKSDSYSLLKQLPGFKRGETPAEKATLEAYCILRIWLPKPVFTSDDDKNGLALEMLNELKKCPRELFDLLSKEQQEENFRIINDSADSEEENETLMRRYADRFPYLALRYFDDNRVFDKLRFHIDLGRYYFKFYPKETIDGRISKRALDRRLKTFGRLNEVKEKVQKEWSEQIKAPDEIDNDNPEPYKANTIPHYHLMDKQIGFTIGGDVSLPDINQPDGKIRLQKPDAWLSIYELPELMFFGYQFGFNKAENLIIQHITRQKEIIEEVKKTGTLPENAGEFLPEAFKEKKKKTTGEKTYAERKLKRMIDDTDQRIRAIGKTKQRMFDSSNKPGKKGYIDIRSGELADYLVKDILAMQPFKPEKEGSDKMTSANYQALQSTLAYYGKNKAAIESIFKRIGLLDGEISHPFLNRIKIAQCKTIIEFYTAYLEARKNYLDECQKQEQFNWQFLRPSRGRYAEEKQELKKIAEELSKHPVNIRNDLFKKQIRELICENFPDLKDKKMNTAYMIQTWFEKEYGGQQPFYNFPRKYPIVSKAENYCDKNRGIKNILKMITSDKSYKELLKDIIPKIPGSDKEPDKRYDPETLKLNLIKYCKDFKNNERLLRRYKVQDMLMFLMMENTLEDLLSFENETIKLKDLMPKNESPFKKPIAYETNITISFKTKEKYESGYVNHIKEKYEDLYLIQGKRMLLQYRLKSENTKLKDIGKYQRYRHDRRLPGLLIWKYPPNTQNGNEIKYSDIEEEIKAYEKHRKEIARCLYSLEKKVIDCLITRENLGDSHISFNEITDKVKCELPGLEEKCNTLLKIRNAINHNQFPAYEETIENTEGKNIAEKMLSITEEYVKYITERINENDKEFANV